MGYWLDGEIVITGRAKDLILAQWPQYLAAGHRMGGRADRARAQRRCRGLRRRDRGWRGRGGGAGAVPRQRRRGARAAARQVAAAVQRGRRRRLRGGAGAAAQPAVHLVGQAVARCAPSAIFRGLAEIAASRRPACPGPECRRVVTADGAEATDRRHGPDGRDDRCQALSEQTLPRIGADDHSRDHRRHRLCRPPSRCGAGAPRGKLRLLVRNRSQRRGRRSTTVVPGSLADREALARLVDRRRHGHPSRRRDHGAAAVPASSRSMTRAPAPCRCGRAPPAFARFVHLSSLAAREPGTLRLRREQARRRGGAGRRAARLLPCRPAAAGGLWSGRPRDPAAAAAQLTQPLAVIPVAADQRVSLIHVADLAAAIAALAADRRLSGGSVRAR